MALLFLFLALLAGLTSASSGPTCYMPDKKTTAVVDIPCTNATYSACCPPDSYCLQNGLCLTNLTLSRGSCTDQTWTSPICAQYCQDYTSNRNTTISPCQMDSNPLFSCGFNNCSKSNFSVPIRNVSIVLRDYQAAGLGFVALTDLPTMTATSTWTKSTSMMGPTSTAEASFPMTECSSNSGKVTAVGAGIGVSFGVALIAALVLFGLERRKARRLNDERSRAIAQQQVLHNKLEWYEKQSIAPWSPAQEVGEERVYRELPTRTHAHELAGETPP